MDALTREKYSRIFFAIYIAQKTRKIYGISRMEILTQKRAAIPRLYPGKFELRSCLVWF